MSWGAYITGEGGLLAQYDKIACGGIFGQNGSTFAQAQDRLFSRTHRTMPWSLTDPDRPPVRPSVSENVRVRCKPMK